MDVSDGGAEEGRRTTVWAWEKVKKASQEVEMKIYLPICLFIFGSTGGLRLRLRLRLLRINMKRCPQDLSSRQDFLSHYYYYYPKK